MYRARRRFSNTVRNNAARYDNNITLSQCAPYTSVARSSRPTPSARVRPLRRSLEERGTRGRTPTAEDRRSISDRPPAAALHYVPFGPHANDAIADDDDDDEPDERKVNNNLQSTYFSLSARFTGRCYAFLFVGSLIGFPRRKDTDVIS